MTNEEQKHKEELKDCPFCGGKAKSHKTDIRPGYQTSSVNCTRCPAEVAKTGLDAEAAWNARTESGLVKELVEALKGMNRWFSLYPEFVPNPEYHDDVQLAKQAMKTALAKAQAAGQEPKAGEREILDDQSEAELRATALFEDNLQLRKRLIKAIGGLCSIAYGEESTWPNCSAREIAKQALLDCGGEKYPGGSGTK